MPLLDTRAAMASKLTPFLMRTAVRSAGRAARPLAAQARTISVSASQRSDTLMVVSASASASGGNGHWRRKLGESN